MNKIDGFIMIDALFGLLIVILCISLLVGCMYYLNDGDLVNETIDEEWFYAD